eukprot:1743076-Pyramimonas_sp.AAC.1
MGHAYAVSPHQMAARAAERLIRRDGPERLAKICPESRSVQWQQAMPSDASRTYSYRVEFACSTLLPYS